MAHIYTTHPGGLPTAKMVPTVVPWANTQGILLKINSDQANWEVLYQLGYGASSRSAWDSRISEILFLNAGKGFQIDVAWGLYEQGASGGDFTNLRYLKTVADEMYDNGLYLILDLVGFREFRNGNVSSLPLIDQMRYLLPPDMRTHQGLIESPNVPAGMEHYLWDYAYAYDKALNNNFGYDLKTWKPVLQARFARFCVAVREALGNHPAVFAITSTESVDGEPVYTGPGGYDVTDGASRVAFFAGKTAIMDSVNAIFKRQIVMQNMNYPNEGSGTADPIDYLSEWFATAAAKGYAITSPNSNWWVPKLNRVATQYVPQGINRYFPNYPGPRIVQQQGDEMDSLVNGAPQISSTADYLQRYVDLYQRAIVGDGGTKFGLNATHIIVQREHPQSIWTGGTTNNIPNVPNGVVVPPMRDFWNNPAYVPQDGKAGLGSSTVTYIT